MSESPEISRSLGRARGRPDEEAGNQHDRGDECPYSAAPVRVHETYRAFDESIGSHGQYEREHEAEQVQRRLTDMETRANEPDIDRPMPEIEPVRDAPGPCERFHREQRPQRSGLQRGGDEERDSDGIEKRATSVIALTGA